MNPLSIAFANEREGYLALGRVPGSPYRVERLGPFVCAWWSAEGGRPMNHALLLDPAHRGSLREALAPLMDRISAGPSRTEIRLVGNEHLERFCDEAKALGFKPWYEAPVMACTLGVERPRMAVPEQVAVRLAESDDVYAGALSVVDAIYSGSPLLNRFFGGRGAVRIYAGFWDGVLACSGALWLYAGAAGIYSLATLPEYRRRGLALAMVQRQLDDAEAEGERLAILRTVDQLVPFYGRLGFRQVGRLHFLVTG